MPEVIDVLEFKNEGFAIVQDTAGKFLINKNDSGIIPLDKQTTIAPLFPQRKPCYLLQSRTSMLT